jgi:hypothetical protein
MHQSHDSILTGRVRGQINMKIYVVLAWLCIGVAFTAKAEPLVTISCEKPEGSSITYGVPLKERLDALAQEQPEPVNPTLRGPTKNEYQGKPTFVIDSNRKKITIVWSENVAVTTGCRWCYCSVPARTDFGHSSRAMVDNYILVFSKDGHGFHRSAIHGARFSQRYATFYICTL